MLSPGDALRRGRHGPTLIKSDCNQRDRQGKAQGDPQRRKAQGHGFPRGACSTCRFLVQRSCCSEFDLGPEQSSPGDADPAHSLKAPDSPEQRPGTCADLNNTYLRQLLEKLKSKGGIGNMGIPKQAENQGLDS
ncbi:hypothetical protein MG293_019081 [Ovis ammon polii]|uniref:Uncharacterized protein n=1 Tax=Ovis ammon polii TaxID=230172 RepID=A0AAD4Y1H4_OVIAM|nr:hypothetical protein MG293_019081 [Ovis ammon polii]